MGVVEVPGGTPGNITRAGVTTDAVERLRQRLRGEVVVAGDPDYDRARQVWNGSIDRRPAMIVRCVGVADVVIAVRFAREFDLPLAVRSGGHSFPGLSVIDDALVVDLRQMHAIRVDPLRRTAQVQAGALLAEVDHEAQAFGLAVPLGAVTHTGVAGLTLGGGIGWLMRKHGLTIDQLRSVDLVTADGELLHASQQEHPDLFWGLRGGGGNFGIVTAFEFALNPVGPTVLTGMLFWPLEQAPEVARFYRDWSGQAPDELTTILAVRKAPALPFVPAELRGRRVIGVACCYAGPVAEGEQVLRPIRAFGSPAVDACGPQPYVAQQAIFDASFPPGNWVYLRGHDVPALTDDLIDATIEHGERIRSDLSTLTVWQLGGAVARVAEDATAYNGRSSRHIYNISGISASADGFEEERAWVREFSEAVAAHQSSVYVNFLWDEGQERVRQAYGEAKFRRLQELKRLYDPDNVFRFNQNIPPA